jgi:hypothetical protein
MAAVDVVDLAGSLLLRGAEVWDALHQVAFARCLRAA